MPNETFAVVIREGKLSVIPFEEGLEFLQRHAGGYIETAFRLYSPEGKHLTIDAFVDEEGLLKQWTFGVAIAHPYPAIFAGPMVIVGGNDRTGETRGLTAREARRFDISGDTSLVMLRYA